MWKKIPGIERNIFVKPTSSVPGSEHHVWDYLLFNERSIDRQHRLEQLNLFANINSTVCGGIIRDHNDGGGGGSTTVQRRSVPCPRQALPFRSPVGTVADS